MVIKGRHILKAAIDWKNATTRLMKSTVREMSWNSVRLIVVGKELFHRILVHYSYKLKLHKKFTVCNNTSICESIIVNTKHQPLQVRFKISVSENGLTNQSFFIQWNELFQRYGRCPSLQEVKASGNSCPICHDSLQEPTILHCKHIFCEECVSTWFDRERTCPMCRAQVQHGPLVCLFGLNMARQVTLVSQLG